MNTGYLVAKVALGGFGVGVQDKGVRDLEPVGHLHVHPCRPTCGNLSLTKDERFQVSNHSAQYFYYVGVLRQREFG